MLQLSLELQQVVYANVPITFQTLTIQYIIFSPLFIFVVFLIKLLQVSFLNTTVQARKDQVELQGLPVDHDIFIVVRTVCMYDGFDPSSSTSIVVSSLVLTQQ